MKEQWTLPTSWAIEVYKAIEDFIAETRMAKSYTIGFARSNDGITWERRDDQAGISRSENGWDSEMICYPAFYPHREKIYMFYSGNGVGRGGIGYAVADNFLS